MFTVVIFMAILHYSIYILALGFQTLAIAYINNTFSNLLPVHYKTVQFPLLGWTRFSGYPVQSCSQQQTEFYLSKQCNLNINCKNLMQMHMLLFGTVGCQLQVQGIVFCFFPGWEFFYSQRHRKVTVIFEILKYCNGHLSKMLSFKYTKLSKNM